MTRHAPLILFSFTLATFNSINAIAEVTVSTNRSQLTPRDSLLLTIESDRQGKQANLSPLNQSFNITGNKEMTISTYAEGQRTTKQRWEVRLRPRRSGELTIPPLEVNGEFSEPLPVMVARRNLQRPSDKPDLPLFIEPEISPSQSYAGAQFIYSINVYSDNPLAEGFIMSEPFISNATVLPLGEVQASTTELHNKEYSRYQQRFAVFPQNAGRHIVEGPVFTGGQQGQPEQEIRADNIDLLALPRANQTSAGYWLPSQQLTIEDHWRRPETMRVGDTVTRTVTLSAYGLPGDQLPLMVPLNGELVDIEVADIRVENQVTDRGIMGKRVEVLNVTLLEHGEVTLPPIDVHWWDTRQDAARIASVPPKVLQVKAARDGTTVISREMAKRSRTQSNLPNAEPANPVQTLSADWLTWGAIGLLAVGCLALLLTISRIRRRREADIEGFDAPVLDRPLGRGEQGNKPLKMRAVRSRAEENAFKNFSNAVRRGDAITSKRRLLEWGNYYWPESDIRTSRDLAQAVSSASFNVLLAELESTIKQGSAASWSGDALLRAVNDLRAKAP